MQRSSTSPRDELTSWLRTASTVVATLAFAAYATGYLLALGRARKLGTSVDLSAVNDLTLRGAVFPLAVLEGVLSVLVELGFAAPRILVALAFATIAISVLWKKWGLSHPLSRGLRFRLLWPRKWNLLFIRSATLSIASLVLTMPAAPVHDLLLSPPQFVTDTSSRCVIVTQLATRVAQDGSADGDQLRARDQEIETFVADFTKRAATLSWSQRLTYYSYFRGTANAHLCLVMYGLGCLLLSLCALYVSRAYWIAVLNLDLRQLTKCAAVFVIAPLTLAMPSALVTYGVLVSPTMGDVVGEYCDVPQYIVMENLGHRYLLYQFKPRGIISVDASSLARYCIIRKRDIFSESRGGYDCAYR